MSRKLRDIIPVLSKELQPKQVHHKVVLNDIARRRTMTKSYYDQKVSAPLKEFIPGEKVLVKPNPVNKHKPWMFGEVIENQLHVPVLCKLRVAMCEETTDRSERQ